MLEAQTAPIECSSVQLCITGVIQDMTVENLCAFLLAGLFLTS
jgi:hypothetical protein